MVAILFLVSAFAFSAELPALSIPKAWSECSSESDCAVAGDACRSCGSLIIINKKFIGEFLAMDNLARKKAGFTRACEACSVIQAKLACKNKVCEHEK